MRLRLYIGLIYCLIIFIAAWQLREDFGSLYIHLILLLITLLTGLAFTYMLMRTRSKTTSKHHNLRTIGIRVDAEIVGARAIPATPYIHIIATDYHNSPKEYISQPIFGDEESVRTLLNYRDQTKDQSIFKVPLYISPTDPSVYFLDIDDCKMNDMYKHMNRPSSSAPNKLTRSTNDFVTSVAIFLPFVIAATINRQELDSWYYIAPIGLLCYGLYRLSSGRPRDES